VNKRAARRAVETADALDRREEARRTERTTKAAEKLWHLIHDGRADTFGRARRLMRAYDGDELERGLAHAIDLGWLVEVEEDTTAGGSKARRIILGEVRP